MFSFKHPEESPGFCWQGCSATLGVLNSGQLYSVQYNLESIQWLHWFVSARGQDLVYNTSHMVFLMIFLLTSQTWPVNKGLQGLKALSEV